MLLLSVDPKGDVVLEPGAYAATATRAARIELLQHARVMASRHVVLFVRVASVGTHLGRIARDVPRRFVRHLGEPGDRKMDGTFVHCFFDEEALLEEIHAAGLSVVSRASRCFVLRAAPPEPEEADSFATEVARVLRVVAAVERARRLGSPKEAVAAARRRATKTRGPVGRARLRRAIGWVDAAMRENCFRRVLLELTLDAGAAKERIVFSLDVGRTGHVAFEGREDAVFDVAFTMEPD